MRRGRGPLRMGLEDTVGVGSRKGRRVSEEGEELVTW